MGKKGTIITVAVLALMLAGIAYAVVRLYHTDTPHPRQVTRSAEDPLSAVPSDAAAIFLFDGSSRAQRLSADSTGLLRPLIAPEDPALLAYISGVSGLRTAVSLHNSGALVPLVVSRLKRQDSLSVAPYLSLACSAGLKSAVREGFLLASRSETLLQSSLRHLDSGLSVLQDPSLEALSARTEGPLVLYLGHQHAAKLLQIHASPAIRKKTDFVRNIAAWSAFEWVACDEKHLVLKGSAALPESVGSFLTAFRGLPAETAQFADVLPYFTEKALSLPIGDPDRYFACWQNYLDGTARLSAFQKAANERAGRPLSPLQWAKDIQMKEVVKAVFTLEGRREQLLLVRTGRDLKIAAPTANPYAGYLETLLGESFAVVDTLALRLDSKWTAYGNGPVIRAYADGFLPVEPLRSRLSEASLSLPAGFVLYGSFSDAPSLCADLFSSGEAAALGAYVTGTAYAPALFSLDLSSGEARMKLSLEKRALKSSRLPILERDTTVVIPTGSFPVKNSQTGKMNSFYQNANLYLCLNDENGKGVWGVPFKTPLCGCVESIDYYANGKIQFLFASGSQLWLIDRLGRFVGGFPVNLGKPVLLGPAVYDFTGAHGYTVMVLHKDHTLERYNLHGQKPEGWKGIAAPETVKALPELLEVKGKRFWAVRTSIRTLIYPFEGGDPLTREEGGRMIKPDSQLTPCAKGVTVDCYDGKSRDIKLN